MWQGKRSLAKVRKRMKAIVGRVFVLIHYRPWPDEYGCQLFRANCYSPSARSVNQRDWRRVAALRVVRGVLRPVRARFRPFFPPSFWIIHPFRNNYIPSTTLIASTQRRLKVLSKFEPGWWVKSSRMNTEAEFPAKLPRRNRWNIETCGGMVCI